MKTDTMMFAPDAFAGAFDPDALQRARNRRAVAFALAWPTVRPIEWPCLYCDFIARGATIDSMRHAMEAHARFVNAHKDHATDPHFEDVRLDALLYA